MTMSILKAGTLMSYKKVNTNKTIKSIQKSIKNQGFSFIEVLVALGIVSISILALLRLDILSIGLADVAETTTQAVMLANEKIEEIKARDDIRPQSTSGTSKRNNLTFHWHSRVENLTALPISRADITGLQKISVDVSWKEGLGKKHLKFSTYVANRKWK